MEVVAALFGKRLNERFTVDRKGNRFKARFAEYGLDILGEWDNPYFDVIFEKEDRESAYHLYPIILKDKFDNHKGEIFTRLRKEGIGVQVHYIPVYKQPYYQKLGFSDELCPVCEKFYKKELSIPMYPSLSDEDIEFVAEKLFNVISRFD